MNELDRVLAADDPLTPSSGFTARVMTAVADAAAETPPLPFPWVRFALGVLACAVAAVSIASFLSLAGARQALEGVADMPGVSEALTAAVLSAAAAQVFRHRAGVEP
jgi:hypothetical protein